MNRVTGKKINHVPKIMGIVFSKNRAMQLHALIESYLKYTGGNVTLHIVYECSTNLHVKSYEKLIKNYASERIVFTRQSNFKMNIVSIIKRNKLGYYFFLVDDILFTRKVDFIKITSFLNIFTIYSLRLGQNIEYDTLLNKNIKIPKIKIQSKRELSIMKWKWIKGDGPWGYPFSLDGNIFPSKTVTVLLRLLKYNNPTELELGLQKFNKIYFWVRGKAPFTSTIMNTPLNRVQNDVNNYHGDLDVDILASQYLNNIKIDITPFNKFRNSSTHLIVDIKYANQKI